MADMFTDSSNIGDDMFLQNVVDELYNLDNYEEPHGGEGLFPPQHGTEEAMNMFHDPLDYEMTSVTGFPRDTATSSQPRQVSAEPLNGPNATPLVTSELPNLAGPGPEPVKNSGMVPHKPDESFHGQQDQYNQMHQHSHETQHPHQQPYMDQQCQYPGMQQHHHQHQHHHQQHMIHEQQQQQMSHMGMHQPPAHPHAHAQHPHLHQHFQTLHLQQPQQQQGPMAHVKSEPNPFVHAGSGLTSPSNAMTHEMQALAMGNSGMVGIHPPSVDTSASLPPTRIPCHDSGEGGAAPSPTSFNVETQKQGSKATSSQSLSSPALVAPPIKATTSGAGTRPAPKSSTRKTKLTPEEKEHRRLVRLAARKERKSVREKERRGRENELFEELASLVNMNPEQRDKASILEAVISELANGDSFTAAESEEMREKLRVMMNRSPEGDDGDDDSGSDSESVASS